MPALFREIGNLAPEVGISHQGPGEELGAAITVNEAMRRSKVTWET